MQFFWSNAPWEIVSRDYTALTLNKAFNTTEYNATNVIYANAMEGIGMCQAMEAYNKMNPDKAVSYVLMRATSNYSMKPVKKLANGTWISTKPDADHVNGYAQAITSYSNAMLQLFFNRSETTRKNQPCCIMISENPFFCICYSDQVSKKVWTARHCIWPVQLHNDSLLRRTYDTHRHTPVDLKSLHAISWIS
jgi:hypothetical protein